MTDRELDALVAEKVMGWHTHSASENVWYQPAAQNSLLKELWEPSVDVSCAMAVVEKLTSRAEYKWFQATTVPSGWCALFDIGRSRSQQFSVTDESLPRAICEAALEAVESSEE